MRLGLLSGRLDMKPKMHVVKGTAKWGDFRLEIFLNDAVGMWQEYPEATRDVCILFSRLPV